MGNTFIGNRLRLLRNDAGMSREELRQRLGVANVTVANYETGNREPNIETILKLADIFEVSTDFLLGKSENRKGLIESRRPLRDLSNALFTLEGMEEFKRKYWDEFVYRDEFKQLIQIMVDYHKIESRRQIVEEQDEDVQEMLIKFNPQYIVPDMKKEHADDDLLKDGLLFRMTQILSTLMAKTSEVLLSIEKCVAIMNALEVKKSSYVETHYVNFDFVKMQDEPEIKHCIEEENRLFEYLCSVKHYETEKRQQFDEEMGFDKVQYSGIDAGFLESKMRNKKK